MYGEAPSEAVILEHHVRVPKYYIPENELPQPRHYADWDTAWPSQEIERITPLRDYQVEPFISMCVAKGGILNLGCGYGKTFIALTYIATRGVKSIVIVDKTNLLEQWKSEALKHLAVKESDIGWVQGNRWDWEDKTIVLASLSTLSRRAKDNKLPEDFCSSFGVAIYDECHHLSAAGFSKTCPLFYGERHGLTATPKREDGLEAVFMNHLGPIHYSRVDQELIPRCVFVSTDISADRVLEEDASKPRNARLILDRAGELNHRKLCAWLGSIKERNWLICHLADRLSSSGHHVLCVTHSKEHARLLNKFYVGSGLASGDVDPSLRRSAIANAKVSFATVDVAAEALDVPSLSAIIVMTPFGARSQGNLLQQALGRIQRRKEGKKEPVAYFIEEPDVHMCRGLLRQVKRKLKEWGYPMEYIDAGDRGGGVAKVQELSRMPIIGDS
jgi:superfamily II DNA or RNA helicase